MSEEVGINPRQIKEIELGVALLTIAIEPLFEPEHDCSMIDRLGIGTFDMAQALHGTLATALEQDHQDEASVFVIEAAHTVAQALYGHWKESR